MIWVEPSAHFSDPATWSPSRASVAPGNAAAIPSTSRSSAKLRSSKPAPASSIRGVVTDRDGAVYEGVHITLAATASSTVPEKSTTSDTNGRFRFDSVPAGPFQITVSSNGFATKIVTGVLLRMEKYWNMRSRPSAD